MNMNGINGYQVYQNNYSSKLPYGNTYEKSSEAKAETGLKEPKDIYEKINIAEVRKEPAALSDKAKELLDKLKKTYNNMDFTVASYSSTEEAQRYLAGGTKEYSVLIDPALLEQMAADEETEKKYTNLLESATNQLADIKEELGEEEAVTRLGISFAADGTTQFFAELEKAGNRQKERIEQIKAEKQEAQKEEENKKAQNDAKEEIAEKLPYEKTKRVRLYADTMEELLEKIREIDWNAVKPDSMKTDPAVQAGSIINFEI